MVINTFIYNTLFYPSNLFHTASNYSLDEDRMRCIKEAKAPIRL
jgi:hypothetical protein